MKNGVKHAFNMKLTPNLMFFNVDISFSFFLRVVETIK